MNNNANKNSTFLNLLPNHKKIQDYMYSFKDSIGQGNFSKVFKGTHIPTNKQVAIKIIELSSLRNLRVQQLLNTQTSILKMISHPNIIGCEEILTSSRNCYIITQYCKGGDLQKRLREIGIIRQKQLYQIGVDIYEGMKYLGSKKIVHRDIKIANIFINNGVYKIADFGFAQIKEGEFQDVIVGSPIYMSPQGFINNIYSQKSDIWAFGILLYELVEGRTPCQNCRSEQELKANLLKQINENSFNSYISLDLKNLIIKCLDINPKLRIELEDIQKSEWMQKAYEQLRVNGRKVDDDGRFDRRQEKYRQSVQLMPQIMNDIRSRKASMSLGSQGCLMGTNITCIGQQVREKSKTNLNEYNLGKEDFMLKNGKDENLSYLKNFSGENSSTSSSQSKNSESLESKIASQKKIPDLTIKTIPVKAYNQFQSLKFKNGIKMINEKAVISEKRKDFSKGKTVWEQNVLKDKKMNEQKISNFSSTMINEDCKISNEAIKSYCLNQNKQKFDVENSIKNTIYNEIQRSFILKKNGLTQKQNKIILNPSNIRIICKPLRFSDCIGLIHYCRLCYKFSSLAEQYFNNEEAEIFLRKWTIQLLTQINDILNSHENSLIYENESSSVNKLKQITIDYLTKYQKSQKQVIGDVITINQASMYIYNLYMKQGFQYTQRMKNRNCLIYDGLMSYLSLLDKQTRNLMEFVYRIKNGFEGKQIQAFLCVKFSELNQERMKDGGFKNKENMGKGYEVL